MDKQIAILKEKIHSLELDDNTIFVYLGDNGTPKGITSKYNGENIEAGKGQTTTYGTRVPLIVNWPGHVLSNISSSQLIDFPDFMPTLADLAGILQPTNFGTIDGESFYSVLVNNTPSASDHIYLYFKPAINPTSKNLIEYVSDSTYKLYDDGNF